MSDNSKIKWTDATWNPVRYCPGSAPAEPLTLAEGFAEIVWVGRNWEGS